MYTKNEKIDNTLSKAKNDTIDGIHNTLLGLQFMIKASTMLFLAFIVVRVVSILLSSNMIWFAKNGLSL